MMPGTRVYRLKWWVRAGALFFLVFSAVFSTVIWWQAIAAEDNPRILLMVLSVVFVSAGSLWTLYAFQSTVAFSEDSIEVRGLLGRKSLPLSAIRGRRTYVVRATSPEGGGNTTYWKLEPKDDRRPTLNFQKDYNFDPAFREWFDALPDLDAVDKERKPNNFGLC